MKKKIVSFLAGMIFMIVFGIVDNGLLFIGMDINPFADMFKDPQLSAMYGNTFSDVAGAILGVIVAWFFLKVFKVEPSEHISVQVFGVFIGCMIPIIIYMLFR